MSPRLVIPVDDPNGIMLAQHFGRANYFAIIELDNEGRVISRNVHPNRGEHAGGMGHAHNNILKLGPDVVIVAGMGPRGLASFQRRSIPVLRADSDSVDQLVESYKQGILGELTEGCIDAHHK